MRTKLLALILILSVHDAYGQQRQPESRGEQSRFGLEQPVDRPAAIPPDVLKILRHDADIRTCTIEADERDKIPAAWFEASEIHLSNVNEFDLVVKPTNACLWGPNLGPFWLFRNTDRGHQLVLSTVAVGLRVLNTRTNGFRDVRAGAIVGASQPRYVTYKFDGRVYRPPK